MIIRGFTAINFLMRPYKTVSGDGTLFVCCYASYVIFELDKDNYEYAFVCGPSLSYLWLLSRKKEVYPQVLARFIEKSKQLGFDTSQLILSSKAIKERLLGSWS